MVAGPAMLLALERRIPRPADLPDKIDGILVLGGAVEPALSLFYGETVFNSAVARVLAGTAERHERPAILWNAVAIGATKSMTFGTCCHSSRVAGPGL